MNIVSDVSRINAPRRSDGLVVVYNASQLFQLQHLIVWEKLMTPIIRTALILFASIASTVAVAEDAVHLFILSGQSNMQGHRPEEAFTPAVIAKYGKDNVVVVQDALGGQPIQRWYKAWKDTEGKKPESTGDLYDRLMEKVVKATKGKEIASVTFIWMQGERDAKMKWGPVYEASLVGLHAQLSKDLKRDDVNFVIGRLSDFDMQNQRYPHWTMVRDIQVKVAKSNPRFAWVDTDDLNDGLNRRGKAIKNDLHYSGEGYKTLGRRFAETAIELIE
ncbi:MAG: sialate O-acetylesterase [Planctomycetota bacterium]